MRIIAQLKETKQLRGIYLVVDILLWTPSRQTVQRRSSSAGTSEYKQKHIPTEIK